MHGSKYICSLRVCVATLWTYIICMYVQKYICSLPHGSGCIRIRFYGFKCLFVFESTWNSKLCFEILNRFQDASCQKLVFQGFKTPVARSLCFEQVSRLQLQVCLFGIGFKMPVASRKAAIASVNWQLIHNWQLASQRDVLKEHHLANSRQIIFWRCVPTLNRTLNEQVTWFWCSKGWRDFLPLPRDT